MRKRLHAPQGRQSFPPLPASPKARGFTERQAFCGGFPAQGASRGRLDKVYTQDTSGMEHVMTKLIVCLPLCLVLQDQRPFTCGSAGRADSGPPPMSPAVKRQLEIARCVGAFAVPSATAFPGTLTWTPLRGLSEHLVPRHERFSVDLVAGLGAISSPTAAAWLPLRQAFVSNGPGVLEDLAYTQPLRFLQMCMAHYEREVKGYHCMLFKHERIKGKLL